MVYGILSHSLMVPHLCDGNPLLSVKCAQTLKLRARTQDSMMAWNDNGMTSTIQGHRARCVPNDLQAHRPPACLRLATGLEDDEIIEGTASCMAEAA